jgi:hypothetical protein
MNKILISNIGNRNIRYKGEEIPVKQFKDLTGLYWNNFDDHEQFITIQIIQNHINEDVEKIYLFVTDQEDPDFNYQDTIFEGYILQKMLSEIYGIKIELMVFNGNPADENEMVEEFGRHIRHIIKDHPDSLIVYNDAGGTTQMKQVVKDMLTYYLPKAKYEIVYTNKNDNKKIIERVYNQKYTLLTIAKQLCNEYAYDSAARVIGYIPSKAGLPTHIRLYCQFARFRMNFQYADAISLLSNPKFQSSNLLINYLEKQVPEGAIDFGDLTIRSRFDVFEIASICQLYFQLKNYTLGVATFYRLCEEICTSFITDSGEYNLSKKTGREKFVADNKFEAIRSFPALDSNTSFGLPILMAYTYIHSHGKLKSLVKLLIPTCSHINGSNRGLNTLRNQSFLAHDNKPITGAIINTEVKNFLNTIRPQIDQALGLPGINIYDQMNKELEKMFMQV